MTRDRRWVGGEDDKEREEVAGLPGIDDEAVLMISGVWDSVLFCPTLSYSIPF